MGLILKTLADHAVALNDVLEPLVLLVRSSVVTLGARNLRRLGTRVTESEPPLADTRDGHSFQGHLGTTPWDERTGGRVKYQKKLFIASIKKLFKGINKKLIT